jgi:hypothetical protein
MIPALQPACCATRYELRFNDLAHPGQGLAFPCDARGRVQIDDLSPRGRNDYFYARVAMGIDLSLPTVFSLG